MKNRTAAWVAVHFCKSPCFQFVHVLLPVHPVHICACNFCLNTVLPLVVGFFFPCMSPRVTSDNLLGVEVNWLTSTSDIHSLLCGVFLIYIGHTKETCVVRANCSPSCLEIALGLSTMDWHSPQGSLLPTARPWLCVSGGSRRGKAESS